LKPSCVSIVVASVLPLPPQYETIVTMAGGSRHYQGICRNELASVINMPVIKRKQQAQLLHQALLVEQGARSKGQG